MKTNIPDVPDFFASIPVRSKKTHNRGLALLVMWVLGGICGISLGIHILMFGFHVDIFGLLKLLPKEMR